MAKEQLSSFNQKLMKALKAEAPKAESKPFITMSKLAEYMTADAIRRRQIITNLKADKDFMKVRYSEVKNIIGSFFTSEYDPTVIDSTIDKINRKRPTSPWDIDDNNNSILALQAMADCDLPDLSDYEFIGDQGIKSIVLSGVTVYVKPDIYLRHIKSKKVGAIKAHIAKTPDNRLADKNREYAATIIKYAFMVYGEDEKNIDIKACISYDVFLKEYSCATASFKRMIAALEAACEEIARAW